MANVTVKLTAYNMGAESDGQAFDAWVRYVADRIDASCKFSVEVDSFDYSCGPAADVVSVENCTWDERDGKTQVVREALESLWAQWCSDGAPGVEVAS